MEGNPFLNPLPESVGQLRRKDLDPLAARDAQAAEGPLPSPVPDAGVSRFLSNNPWFGELVKKTAGEVKIPKELVDAGAAIDPKSIPGMMDLLGPDYQPTSIPLPPNPFLNSTSADPAENPFLGHAAKGSDAGRQLASHRWRRLQKAGEEQGFPVPGVDSQRYDELVPGGVSGVGDTPTEDQLEASRNLTGMNLGGRPTFGITNPEDKSPLVPGLDRPFNKQEIPNPVFRGVSNVLNSGLALEFAPTGMMIEGFPATRDASGKVHFDPMAPVNVVKGLAHYVGNIAVKSGKAAAWAAIKAQNPAGADFFIAQGLDPMEIVDAWAEDPMGVTGVLLAGTGAGIKYGKKGTEFAANVTEVMKPGGLPLLERPRNRAENNPGLPIERPVTRSAALEAPDPNAPDFKQVIGPDGKPTGPGFNEGAVSEYEHKLDQLKLKKNVDERRTSEATRVTGPASESAQAFTGRPLVQMPEQTVTHFEAALDALRNQMKTGGAPGLIEQKTPGKRGGGVHPLEAVLSEYQLIHPELTRKQIKELWAKDSDAFLRNIAEARAKDAVRSVTEPAGYDPRIKERKGPGAVSETAEGVGSEPTAPINRPLGHFPNARLGDIRRATKNVEDFHKQNTPKPKGRGTILGMGAGNLQRTYEELVERIKNRRQARTDKGLLTKEGEPDQFTPEQIKALGDALNDEMTNPRDLRVSPEDLAKLKANPAVPGADYVPTPTPEKAAVQFQPMLERRSFGTQREYIRRTTQDWHDQKMSYNDAHDAVELMKLQGKITGAQESAFYREIQNAYRDKTISVSAEESIIPPEVTDNTLEQQLSEQRQARPPIPREPGGFSVGPLKDEPKGPTMGAGLGGMHDNLEKTWSNAARILEELPDKIKSESFINHMKNLSQKIGVPLSKAEMEALELDKFALANRGQQIEKSDLRTWVADRVVRTEEKELRLPTVEERDSYEAKNKQLNEARVAKDWDAFEKLSDEIEALDSSFDRTRPKFVDNTAVRLPGGENYREVLVKAPMKIEEVGRARFPDGSESILGGPQLMRVPDYEGGHFDPNTIAHMRTTDRTTTAGKTLFAEEFQSDWEKASRAIVDNPLLEDKAPNHPLLGEWKETLLKRLLRKATEEGQDAVGWTTGKQQADRYNLRKHVESVEIQLSNTRPETPLFLRGRKKSGEVVVSKFVSEKGLEDAVGKEVAQKLLKNMAESPGGRGTINGPALEIGGRWTTELYDKQMVDIANKWAKRFGGKVEQGLTETGNVDTVLPSGNIKVGGRVKETVHTLRLNDAMKKSLLEEGNPTFGFLTKEGHAQVLNNMRNMWKRMGRTLGSGPGEPIYGLMENLTKIGLYHLKRGVTDFTAWSQEIRAEADKAGFSITDQMLQDVWNTSGLRNARMPLDQKAATAASIGAMNTQTSASVTAGQANVNAAAQLLAPQVGTGPTSLQAITAADQFLGMAHRIWTSDFFSRSGIDAHARTYFPTQLEAATKHVNAVALSFVKAGTHTKNIRKIFESGGTPKERVNQYMHDIADLAHDDKGRAIRAKGERQVQALRNSMEIEYNEAVKDKRFEDAAEIQSAIRDLGPADVDIPLMDNVRRDRLLRDPKMQEVIRYIKERVMPEVDTLSTEVGVDKRLNGPLGLYFKFRQIDAVTAAKMKRTRPVGQYVPKPGAEQSVSRTGVARSASPFASRVGRSGSANEATGKLKEGMGYENDLRYMLEHTYTDRLLAKTKNDFRKEVIKSAVASKSTNGTKPVPLKVRVGQFGIGKFKKDVYEPITSVTFEGTNPYNGDTHHVPNTVARLFNETMDVSQNPLLRDLWDKASSFSTSLVIAMPAEAVRHGFNALAATVNTRFWHKHGPLAETAESFASAFTFGLSKMAIALTRAYNREGPALAKDIENYAAAGGLRLGNFEGARSQKNVVLKNFEKIPGMHGIKDLIFGDPGTTKGFRGLETRLRIVIGETIKEIRPELSDVEVGGLLNDAYGTYVGKQQPQIARMFLPLDPFARAGTALTRTGIRMITGRDVTGHYHPMMHMQVAGTIAAILAYNMALDDDHKLPTEHADYRPGDLILARRGGRVYRLTFSDLANPIKRGAEAMGINAVAQALVRGETSRDVLIPEMVRGIRNSFVNRYSPLVKAIDNLATGKAEAQSPSGDFYSTTKPAMAGSKRGGFGYRVVDQAFDSFPILSKAGHLATEVGGLMGTDNMDIPSMLKPSPEREQGGIMPDAALAKVAYRINDMFSVPYFPQILSEDKLASKKGDVQRRIQQQYTDTVRSITREALNYPEAKRVQYVMDQIDLRIADQVITELGHPMPGKPAALKSCLSMLFRSSMYNTKAEILQHINLDPIPAPSDKPTPVAPQPPAAPSPADEDTE